MRTVDAILWAFIDGRIVRDHAISELCRLASGTRPATFADRVPDEFLREIRAKTTDIPRPDELISLFGGSLVPGTDLEAWHLEQEGGKVRYVEGLRAWKAYFEAVESSEPKPHGLDTSPPITRTHSG